MSLEELLFQFNQFLSNQFNAISNRITTLDSEQSLKLAENKLATDQILATILASMPKVCSTYDEIVTALKDAGILAKEKNKNITVFLQEGDIDIFDTLVIPGHVNLVSVGRGIKGTRLIYKGVDGESVAVPKIILDQKTGYGSLISNIEVRVADPNAQYLIALSSLSGINCKISDFRFAHYGLDCRGIYVSGRESIIIENIDVRCSQPLVLGWGDNFSLSNIDLGAATTPEALLQMNKDLISSCLTIINKQDHLSTHGFQTYQGGHYAIHMSVNHNVFCSGLFFDKIRYEQSLSKADPNTAAIHIEFLGKHCETIYLGAGMRLTDRVNGVYIKNCNVLDIEKAVRISGHRIWDNKKWDYNIKEWVLI